MPDIPLAEQIGLDLLAAELARDRSPTLLICSDEPRSAAARQRLAAMSDERPATRVLWISTGAADDREPPWELVAPSGRLALLAPGPLAGVFDHLRGRPPRSRPAVRRAGFRSELTAGIGGPATVFWAGVARVASLAHRHDLVDRFEFRYRRALAPRRSARLCELIAAVLRRID